MSAHLKGSHYFSVTELISLHPLVEPTRNFVLNYDFDFISSNAKISQVNIERGASNYFTTTESENVTIDKSLGISGSFTFYDSVAHNTFTANIPLFYAPLAAPQIHAGTWKRIWNAAKSLYEYSFGVDLSPGQTLNIYSAKLNKNIYSVSDASNPNGYVTVSNLEAVRGDALTLFDNRNGGNNDYVSGQVIPVPSLPPSHNPHVLAGNNTNNGAVGDVYNISYSQDNSGAIIIEGKVNASEIYIYNETSGQWLNIVDGMYGLDTKGRLVGDIDKNANGVINFEIAVNKGDVIVIFGVDSDGSVNEHRKFATLYTDRSNPKKRDRDEGVAVFALPFGGAAAITASVGAAMSMDLIGAAAAVSAFISQDASESSSGKSKLKQKDRDKKSQPFTDLMNEISLYLNQYAGDIIPQTFLDDIQRSGLQTAIENAQKALSHAELNQPLTIDDVQRMNALRAVTQAIKPDFAMMEVVLLNLMQAGTVLAGFLALMAEMIYNLTGQHVLNNGKPSQYSLLFFKNDELSFTNPFTPGNKSSFGGQQFIIGYQPGGLYSSEISGSTMSLYCGMKDLIPGWHVALVLGFSLDYFGVTQLTSKNGRMLVGQNFYTSTSMFAKGFGDPLERAMTDRDRNHFDIISGVETIIELAFDLSTGETDFVLGGGGYARARFKEGQQGGPLNFYLKHFFVGLSETFAKSVRKLYNGFGSGSGSGSGSGTGANSDGGGSPNDALDVKVGGFQESLKKIDLISTKQNQNKVVKTVADSSKWDHNKTKNDINAHFSSNSSQPVNIVDVTLSDGNMISVHLSGDINASGTKILGAYLYNSKGKELAHQILGQASSNHTFNLYGIMINIKLSAIQKINTSNGVLNKRYMSIRKVAKVSLDVQINHFGEYIKDAGVSTRPSGASKDIYSYWKDHKGHWNHTTTGSTAVVLNFNRQGPHDDNLVTIHLSDGNTLFVYLSGPIYSSKTTIIGIDMYDSHAQPLGSDFTPTTHSGSEGKFFAISNSKIKIKLEVDLTNLSIKQSNGVLINKRQLSITKL